MRMTKLQLIGLVVGALLLLAPIQSFAKEAPVPQKAEQLNFALRDLWVGHIFLASPVPAARFTLRKPFPRSFGRHRACPWRANLARHR